MQPVRHHGWKIALLLGAILATLFYRSFLPGEVLFSNDGPLGQLQAQMFRMPQALSGIWGDLNYLGNYQGSAGLSLSYALLWLLGPSTFAGFYAPLSLLLLGLSAWFACRTRRSTLPPQCWSRGWLACPAG